jgi:PST family polysaccharide transporter
MVAFLTAIRTSLGITIDAGVIAPPRRPRSETAGDASGGLKQQTLRGGAVALGSQALKLGLRIASMMILARLLAPDDFGLQGMILVVTGFLNLFRDAGLSLATVQRRTVSHEQTSMLFWINAGLGVALAAVLALLAPALAAFYREPRLQLVAMVSALAFVLTGLGVQHQALLQRNMRFGALAAIDLVSFCGSAMLGIGMAAAGWGYWSLVGMTVSAPLVTAVGTWLAVPWIPGMPRRGCDIRSMLHLGGTWTFIGVIVYVAYNAEKTLLGRFWGAEALGLYGRAYQLINLPTELVNTSIMSVVVPALSRLQHDAERLKRTFLACYGAVLSLTIPATLVCAVFAEEIIAVVLGRRWGQAVPILRALAPTILAFALMNPFSWFLASTARNRLSIGTALLVPPTVILGVLSGIQHGPLGVALGYSAGVCVLALPIIGLCRSAAGITGLDLWSAIRRPLWAGLASAAAGLALKLAVGGATAPIITLILGLIVVCAVYVWTLLVVFDQRNHYLEMARLVCARPVSD